MRHETTNAFRVRCFKLAHQADPSLVSGRIAQRMLEDAELGRRTVGELLAICRAEADRGEWKFELAHELLRELSYHDDCVA